MIKLFRSYGTENVVNVGDKNMDGKVDFIEFKEGVDNYVEMVFNILDKDGDGSLDKDISIKSLNSKFFLQLLNEGFVFFDVNQDEIMSVEDAPPRTFNDRNEDGKISFRDVFGVTLISLPAPLFHFYSSLDKDDNEKISMDEATNFVKGALATIDKNEDCYIDIDEILSILSGKNLPKQYQLGVKLLLDFYFGMGDFILKEFVIAADSNGDKKTTLSEIIGLKDPAVLFDILSVWSSMDRIVSNGRAVSFLIGNYWDVDQEEVVEMWLKVLHEFVGSSKFQAAPTDYCGL